MKSAFLFRLFRGSGAGLVLMVLTAFVVGACAGPTAMQNQGDPTPELDYSTTRTSDQGHFVVSFTSALDPIAINQIHSWTLHVETADGAPVENAAIQVSGDMPEHRHGMPTQPQVTQNLGGGDYLVEGMRFQMGGWWTVTFEIDADGVQDSVTFNLRLR